jgi:hypothetical protein
VTLQWKIDNTGIDVALAEAHGAVPLIVVPQFGPEEPVERMLRQRVLNETGLPYVLVELDPSWRLPGESHPDARATGAIAAAVAARLQGAAAKIATQAAQP